MSEGVPEGVRAQGSKRERRRQQESWCEGAKERGSEGVVRGARGSEAADREESSGQALASVLPAVFGLSLWLQSLVCAWAICSLCFITFALCKSKSKSKKCKEKGRAIPFPCAVRSLFLAPCDLFLRRKCWV